jgi:hypothetical protein
MSVGYVRLSDLRQPDRDLYYLLSLHGPAQTRWLVDRTRLAYDAIENALNRLARQRLIHGRGHWLQDPEGTAGEFRRHLVWRVP